MARLFSILFAMATILAAGLIACEDDPIVRPAPVQSTACVDYARHYPRTCGELPLPFAVRDMKAAEPYLFVAGGDFYVFDVTAPCSPRLVSTLNPAGNSIALDIDGDHAFIVDGGRHFAIADISDPEFPSLVGGIAPGQMTYTTDVDAAGDFAYVASGKIYVIDVSNPASPTLVDSVGTEGRTYITIQGTYGYVAGEDGLLVLDLSQPAHPTLVSPNPIGGCCATDIAVEGKFALVTNELWSSTLLDLTAPSAPVVVKTFPASTPDGISSAAIHDGLAVTCVGEYAMLIDLSSPDPADAAHVAQVPEGAFHAAFLRDGSMLVLYGYGALRTVDVSMLDDSPAMGALGLGGSHLLDVAVTGDTAVLANASDSPSLEFVNIANPRAPIGILGSVALAGKALAVEAAGTFAYVAAQEAGMYVVDVSHPAGAAIVGHVDTPDQAVDVAVVGSIAYVADQTSLQVIDVSQPGQPDMVGSNNAVHPYRLSAIGSFVYVGDGSRLRVIDASNPQQPGVVGEAWDLGDTQGGVFAAGSYAYVGHGWYDGYYLSVVDITTATAPVKIATVPMPSRPLNMALRDRYLYVADGSGALQVIDVSNPFAPRVVGGAPVPSGAMGVALKGSEIYVAGADGLHVFPLECGSP